MDMTWSEGEIDGCIIAPFTKYSDNRGWLAEIFRSDELPGDVFPRMGYISQTDPGRARGPHEHEHQTDLFAFCDGSYRVYLWDDREDSKTYGKRIVLSSGAENPMIVIIPPGVVHAYQNVGDRPALVINCPSRLYGGEGRSEAVDEIRHEDRSDQRFSMD